MPILFIMNLFTIHSVYYILSRRKPADLFIICYRSASRSVADLQIVFASSTDYLHIICRMSAEYLQNICKMSADLQICNSSVE